MSLLFSEKNLLYGKLHVYYGNITATIGLYRFWKGGFTTMNNNQNNNQNRNQNNNQNQNQSNQNQNNSQNQNNQNKR